MTGFDDCVKIILAHEGGYVNDPRDNGGETNLGVTRKSWEAWTGRTCKPGEMRGLTVAKVKPLYKARYWDVVKGDDLPPAIALGLFDMGVNAGPGRAAKMLQRVVGVPADGQIGPATLRAVAVFVSSHGVPELVRQFQNTRRDYYRALDDFPHFGRGWLRRVDQNETECLRMVP